jgi:hypothetical protein
MNVRRPERAEAVRDSGCSTSPCEGTGTPGCEYRRLINVGLTCPDDLPDEGLHQRLIGDVNLQH